VSPADATHAAANAKNLTRILRSPFCWMKQRVVMPNEAKK
jgi:hypothetical protein